MKHRVAVATMILLSMGCGLASAQSMSELITATWAKANTKPMSNAPAKVDISGLNVTEADHPGLYAVTSSGNLKRIEGRVTSFQRSGSRLACALTLGIHANRTNTQIAGTHAHVVVSERPQFYYLPLGEAPGIELVLTSLSQKNGRRQFEVQARGLFRDSEGLSARHQADFDVTEVKPGLYRLVTDQLERGEYAFYLYQGQDHARPGHIKAFVYDFEVE
jgi:hypothetical protein